MPTGLKNGRPENVLYDETHCAGAKVWFKPSPFYNELFYWLTISGSTNQHAPLICIYIYKQTHVDLLF